MSVKAADIDRVFNKLAMRVREGGDKLAWFYYDDKPVLFTKRSHGSGDVGNIAHLIRQQLKVNEDQFRGLIRCNVGYEDYVGVLRRKGLLN